MVAALVKTIFVQPDPETALRHVLEVVLAHLAFPADHRRQLHSTNPLERLNKGIDRRRDVVGIFPNRPSMIRLAGASSGES